MNPPSQTCLQVIQNVGILKICLSGVERNIIIESLDFLVWYSFTYENFVIDKSHVEKNCWKKSWNEWVMDGQSWLSKRSLEKNIDFHL
jgi:hypothetical protein